MPDYPAAAWGPDLLASGQRTWQKTAVILCFKEPDPVGGAVAPHRFVHTRWGGMTCTGESGGARVLVGYKKLRERNWANLPFDPKSPEMGSSLESGSGPTPTARQPARKQAENAT